MEEFDRQDRLIFPDSKDGRIQYKQYLDEVEGVKLQDLWLDVYPVNPVAKERNGYPTQKPESLLNRIISMTTVPNDLVFDCFMGSGTTQAVAMKLGRKFIGADINLGAIQTTTKRLLSIAKEIKEEKLQHRLIATPTGGGGRTNTRGLRCTTSTIMSSSATPSKPKPC
jgi:site-specific DNA-methyltransferase (adenine-specific)/adenine-specific DNA-methyltransferase